MIRSGNEFIDLSIVKPYRKIINSAADFNKVVIVLEPERVEGTH